MGLLPFAIVVLGAFHGAKMVFLGIKLGLAGGSVLGLNMVILGLILVAFPVFILEKGGE